jgi:hypothetical protein
MMGVARHPDQVFAIAPHPATAGSIATGTPMPMSPKAWHYLALQMRDTQQAQE